MPLPIPASARHRAAVLASLIIAAAIGGYNGRADAQAPAPSLEAGRSTVLPPIAKTALAEALAREELAKRRGWRRGSPFAVSFPLPLCLFEGGLCGAVNRDGSIAIEPRFDFVDDFHEGRAVVRSAGLYGYVDVNGRVVVEPQYALVGRYWHGLAEVDVGGKSALIDLEGRQILAPRFASAIAFTNTVFWVNDGERGLTKLQPGREEFLGPANPSAGSPLRRNARWGLIDATGAWLREPEFRDIAEFDPDNENLMWAQAATGWGLIRPDGTWALEPTFQYKKELSDGLAAVWRDRKLGYLDRSGQIAIAPKFDIPSRFSSEFAPGMPAPAQRGKLVGLIDRSGNWVLEPTYDSIYGYPGGEPVAEPEFRGFMARRGEKTDILDRSGKAIISDLKPWPGTSSTRVHGNAITVTSTPGQYPMFCPDGRIIGFLNYRPWLFDRDGSPLDLGQGELWWPLTCEPPYTVKIGNKYGYVDRSLRPLTTETFDAVSLFRHGLAAVVRDGKYGLLRADGTWAVKPTFELAHPFQADSALVKTGGRFVLLKVSTFAWLTQQSFDHMCRTEYGLAGAVIEGKAGLIDATGAWVVQPKYNAFGFGDSFISGFGGGLLPVRAGEKWGFVDVAGNEVIPPQFNAVSKFDRGVSWVENDGEWCPIDRRGDRIAGISCQKTVPTNILNPRAFGCRIVAWHMPEAPQPKAPSQDGLDRPLIAPKKLD